jgi:Mce-associated membrane protein
MEGDAGASRLNPNDSDDSSCSEVTAEDSASEVTAEDSAESEVGADQTSTAEDGTDQETTEVTAEESASEVMAEDFEESEVGADQTSTAEDAEDSASEVTAEDFEESEVGADQTSTAEDAEDATEAQDDAGIPSRLGRGWFVGIAAALVVLAGGVGAGGYLALRSHLDSQAIARRDAAAMEAAKNCVAATQAPDTTAMAASAQKMIDCGTGAYRSQAILYSSLLVEAYQAANAHVQVSDLRAAVERNNPDGSVDVLVPLRVKVSNSESQNQEAGYRLRVTMVSDEGQYRIAKLDQVAK